MLRSEFCTCFSMLSFAIQVNGLMGFFMCIRKRKINALVL